MSALLGLACTRCGREADPAPHALGCPACRAEGAPANLRTVYDLARAGGLLRADLAGEARGTARYRALLPVLPDDGVAGLTAPSPLLPAPRLAESVGVARLWIKDESRGLSWSFKDRAAAMAAAHARALGVPVLVTASTGNAAAATAAHARRAGLVPVVVFARGVDPLMAAFVAGYGARVAIAASKRERWRLVAEAVAEHGWYPMSNYSDPPVGNSPYANDGYKAIAFETWEQLGRRAPDAVYFPVCYGDAIAASRRAFAELAEIGLADRVPAHSGGEVQGTIAAALAAGSDAVPRATEPRATAATSIAADQSTFQAVQAVRESGGAMHAVSEEELAAAQAAAAGLEGVLLEAAAAAGLAALARHVREGVVDPGSEVVVVASSTGLKSLGARLHDAVPGSEVTEVAELAALVGEERVA